jgi:hypothetical protein
VPAQAERHRELPVMVRLKDGTLVDGRIDLAWIAKEWIQRLRMAVNAPAL